MSESVPNTNENCQNAHYLSKKPTGNPEVDMYRQHLARSPYDGEAWFGLIRAARYANDAELLYNTYEDALRQYPSSGNLLAAFAEFELGRGNKESAEAVFNGNLFNVPSIELWKCYLNYVLLSNVDEQGMVTQPERRATVMECYKLVMENIGCDREAGQIWTDYIAFLNSVQPYAQYEEQQKNDLLRDAYRSAVATPVMNVEEIWKSYDAFENKLDRAAAKQLLSRVSPSYMTARTALREMNKLWDAINRFQSPHALPAPPGWSSREVNYLEAWKKYLKWEMSNPLRLDSALTLRRRITYAYNQACMALRFYPEVWIEFADYLQTCDLPTEALAKLQAASEVLPSSMAVQLAYAEMAEKQKQPTICKHVYEQIVSSKRSEIDSISQKYSRKINKLDKKLQLLVASKTTEDDQEAMQGVVEASDDISDISSDSDSDDDGQGGGDKFLDNASEMSGPDLGRPSSSFGISVDHEALSPTEKARKAIEGRIAKIKARMENRLDEKRELYTLSWIMYLRYVQRSEGIDAARQLLRRPRKDPVRYVTHHLYVAAALMEYHVAKRPGVAGKLFEVYSKVYPDSLEYIIEYMNYLINSGDDNNARALFERFQGTSIGESGHLWSMVSDYEYNYGDMGAIAKLDKRMIDKFEHESVLTRMASRYSYLDVRSVADNEFGFPYRKDIQGDVAADSIGARRFAAPNEDSGSAMGSGADYGRGGTNTNNKQLGERESVGEQLGVSVGTVTGRHLNKNQLLAPVNSSRFVKPIASALEEYDPVIEPYVASEAQPYVATPTSAVSARSDAQAAYAKPGQKSYTHLLEQGDVLNYVAGCVAAIDTDSFDSHPLNIEALMYSVMKNTNLAPRMHSVYRPLAFMPWLKQMNPYQKQQPPHRQHSSYSGSSYNKNDRASGNSYAARSRSRGYASRDDGDSYRSGESSSKSYSRGGGHSSRHTPYSRSDNRPPYRGGGGQHQGSRSNDRGGNNGRDNRNYY
ncbi:mRNA 3'-end-processing protein rna14 [Kickxella alabastrina]|uniref:mRNA 3'-end-processing protein rna14 n=1 Tax=Kickxella alabastrina TaxID=61397 RepID=A0ACC1IHB6_9FUNG|nr:mRNA 3'-end-processing protein rna14 [Kickxella alabastrina]